VVNLADTAATVEECDVELWEPMDADIVVADPSRGGLGKRGAAAVTGTDAEVVVLVSCDAPAAARDASLLMRHGHELVAVSVLDLFPDTHHIEVVSTFVRS
jgi:23S rRNA (uracil1939-C5)-methyltransferase